MSTYSPIKHQTQPTPMSCVCTCVAMLANRPALEVVEAWHQRFYVDMTASMLDVMRDYGISATPPSSGTAQVLSPGFVYIVTVASLNVRGGFHEVLVDYRDPARPCVYDPAKGYGNRAYYTVDTNEVAECKQAFELFSWIVDYIVEVPDEAEISSEVSERTKKGSQSSSICFNQAYEG